MEMDDELKEMFKDLAKKFDAFELKLKREKLYDKFMLKLDKLKIPLLYGRGVVIDTEEQLDIIIEEIKKRYLSDEQNPI